MKTFEDGTRTTVRSWRASVLAGVSIAALATASMAATPALRHVDMSKFRAMLPHLAPTARGRLARLNRSAGQGQGGRGAGETIPYWTTSITSPADGKTYA